jgi:uncharacterized protein YlaN (UPF0358 family)
MVKLEEKPVPIDESKIDLERLKDKIADLPALMEYAHSVGGFAIIPTKEGHIKSRAMQAMREQTSDQLEIIYEQMKTLALQARKLRERVDLSHQIYEAQMNFEPEISGEYYLYEKEDGKKIISLVAPEEWRDSKGYQKCHAKIKMLSDHTWKIIKTYED